MSVEYIYSPGTNTNSKKGVVIIGLCILVLVLAIILIVVTRFKKSSVAVSAHKIVAQTYISALKNDDATTAYNLLVPASKTVSDAKKFESEVITPFNEQINTSSCIVGDSVVNGSDGITTINCKSRKHGVNVSMTVRTVEVANNVFFNQLIVTKATP